MRGPYTELYVHLVWATWDRLPLLVGEVERQVYRSLKATCVALHAEVKALGGIVDHVHVVVRVPAMLAIADLVKHLKGSSSHMVTHKVAPDTFLKWQGAYGAFSVVAHSLSIVCSYALNQKDHRLGTLVAAYELPMQSADDM